MVSIKKNYTNHSPGVHHPSLVPAGTFGEGNLGEKMKDGPRFTGFPGLTTISGIFRIREGWGGKKGEFGGKDER
jgi:hypothetical protein